MNNTRFSVRTIADVCTLNNSSGDDEVFVLVEHPGQPGRRQDSVELTRRRLDELKAHYSHSEEQIHSMDLVGEKVLVDYSIRKKPTIHPYSEGE